MIKHQHSDAQPQFVTAQGYVLGGGQGEHLFRTKEMSS